MKYYFTYLIILLSIFFWTNSVFAQNTNRSLGGGTQGTPKTSNEVFEDFLSIFFSTKKKPTSAPGQNDSFLTPPATNPSAIPTPLNSLTPFPTVDPNIETPQGSLTYSSQVTNGVQECLKNRSIYEQASTRTSIPWQYLAAIHYMEGNCNPTQSLVSGRKIGAVEPDVGSNNCSSMNSELGKPIPVTGGCGFTNLLSSAVYAGNHLSGKIGKPPKTLQELAKAFGRYNGIGNANCNPETGAPRTPYKGCPAAYEGDDHIYATSKLDEKHATMYLRYCGDGSLCANPPVFERIGALTVIHIINNVLKVI